MADIQAYLARKYPVVIGVEKAPDGQEHFAAWPLDLPGCIAQGSNRVEARQRLAAIMPAYFQALIKNGVAIPEPTKLPRVLIGPVGFYDSKSGFFHTAPEELSGPLLLTDPKSFAAAALV